MFQRSSVCCFTFCFCHCLVHISEMHSCWILCCVNFSFQVVGGRERAFILGTHPIFVAQHMGIRERGIAAVKPSAKISCGFPLICVVIASFTCGWIACFLWLLFQPLDSPTTYELWMVIPCPLERFLQGYNSCLFWIASGDSLSSTWGFLHFWILSVCIVFHTRVSWFWWTGPKWL